MTRDPRPVRRLWFTMPLIAAALSGCISHWVVEPVAPATAVTVGSASEYRISFNDGSRTNIYDPTVAGDSIIAFASPKPAWPDEPKRVAIAISDVTSVSARKVDAAASAGLALGITSVLVIGFYVEIIGPLASMR